VLADSGGSNSCTSWAWKTEIQAQVCNAFGLTATIAHYPTGASKWNPIEHRLFSEISKNWVAEPLDSYEKMLNFIRNTSTKTGLAVTAYLDRKEYPTGLKPDPRLISSLRLKRSNTHYRNGTTPLRRICKVNFASTLRCHLREPAQQEHTSHSGPAAARSTGRSRPVFLLATAYSIAWWIASSRARVLCGHRAGGGWW